jgi:exopolyphosphatase/guanosine-5'-triphosphate,3'-diphosphate pyrophosphatase
VEASQILAAIDIGSNAVRLVIGEVDHHGDIRVLKKTREPVRLGADVFGQGVITHQTRDRLLEAFLKFRELIAAYHVRHTRAVATSALREATNRDALVNEVHKASGIRIDVIDGIEEGRLIFSAVSHRVDLEDKTALLIDIGGGSVELTLAEHGSPIGTQSFKLGTVRLLQLIADRGLREKNLPSLIHELFAPAREFVHEVTRDRHVDVAIGTGGNFEALGKLRVALLHKTSIFSMTRTELQQLVHHLQLMTVKERIQFLRLRPDRADVVVPAALVTIAAMSTIDLDLLMIPYVGLRDGILTELSERLRSTVD